MQDYSSILRTVYFFRGLSDGDISALAARCAEDRFSAGDIVFREGATGDRFYIVTGGEVEVWKDYDRETRDLLAVHGQGHLFGEMALVDDLPRSATVRARSDTSVLFLSREDFTEVVRTEASVALSILKSLSAMVRSSNDSFVASLARRNEQLHAAYTELQATQEELLRAERLSNVGKFSSMILHDIRNPISAVKGYAELILVKGDDPGRVEQYCHSILREADRLHDLAGELLDYSRGEIRLDVRLVDVETFLQRFKLSVEERFRSRGLEVVVDNGCTEPALFDDKRMVRVLMNLAENARKAMKKGGRLSVVAERVGVDTLQLTVRDTGAGMAPEVLERMFEPFYSVTPGGTGLGLLIVKNVVEAHDGTLEVESVPGRGTTFTITIPSR
ncbi:MAG: histidine kinase [Spirochaetaceae bacterium]|nr:MAG: histidine kinase [Spirochaetaceae bacterium]